MTHSSASSTQHPKQHPFPLVALVSGGKDSIYNIQQCLNNNYSIQCLAHLYPEQPEQQQQNQQENAISSSSSSTTAADSTNTIHELDSYMFQSVGHNVVTQAYQQCLGIPLITHPTKGISKFRNLQYHNNNPQEPDEVEDLYELLRKVLERFPNIKGVTCGAIFSDYQRNRVENVCQRLGLVSVAMIWRREQDELLQEMIDNSIEAILLKTATIGLKPQLHCGKSIQELYDYLMKLKDQYQINCCGEGGEYETLVLDSPLFSKRIVIDESRVVVDSNDDFAPSGHLIVEKLHLEDKDMPHSPFLNTETGMLEPLRPEGSNDVDSQSTAPSIFIAKREAIDPEQLNPARVLSEDHLAEMKQCIRFQTAQRGNYFHVEAHFSAPKQDGSSGALKTSPQHQMLFMMSEMKQIVEKTRLPNDAQSDSGDSFSMSDALHMELHVKDMTRFSALNQVYTRFFSDEPPSRVCIEDSVHVSVGEIAMTCVFGVQRENSEDAPATLPKKVLHVQSVSAWAPSCIGPYSQATVLDHVIRMAGQVAFIPETMQMHTSQGVTGQSSLCIKNIQQVLCALRSDLSNALRCLIYVDKSQMDGRLASDLVQQFVTFASGKGRVNAITSCSLSHRHGTNEDWILQNTEVVPVTHLPRSAAVEYHVHAMDDGVEEIHTTRKEQVLGGNGTLHTLLVDGHQVFGSVSVYSEALPSSQELKELLVNEADLAQGSLSRITVFHTTGTNNVDAEQWRNLFSTVFENLEQAPILRVLSRVESDEDEGCLAKIHFEGTKQ